MEALQQLRDMAGLSKRRKILGLPIGSKQTDWAKVAKIGAGAGATGVVGYAGTKAFCSVRKGGSGDESAEGDSDKSEEGGSSERQGLLSKGAEAVRKSPAGQMVQKGEEVVERGRDAMGAVTKVAEQVSGATSAVGRLKGSIPGMGSSDGDEGTTKKQRLIIQEHIDVAVPRDVAYEQWTKFDEFDEIFRAVQNVEEEETEEGEDETRWQAKILTSTRRWTSTITDRTPGRRIAWTSKGDVQHIGAVTFHEIDDHLTRIHLEMEYHPTGFVEKFGNLFLTVRHRVRKDLRLFKHHLELQGPSGEEGEEEGAGQHGEAGSSQGSTEAQAGSSSEQSSEAHAGGESRSSEEVSSRDETQSQEAAQHEGGEQPAAEASGESDSGDEERTGVTVKESSGEEAPQPRASRRSITPP